MKREKWLWIWIVVALVLSAWTAGRLLIVEDALRPADAVVVISGDHKPERMQRAAELYTQGYAPIVILSAGTLVSEGVEQIPEAQVMRRQALALGIPETALFLETDSRTTYRNAAFSKQRLQRLAFDSILLATSAYHSRRARRIFNDVMGTEIAVSVQPAPADYCALCWPLFPDHASVVLYEYWNWARYWLDPSYFEIE